MFAKKAGANFEDRFQKYCYHAQNVSAIRIEDGCKRIGANRFIAQRQPFDWIVFYEDKAIFCDTKTTLEGSYSLNMEKIDFQMRNFKIVVSHNHVAGYLVEFREAGEFRWYSYERLIEILKERKSLKKEDGLLLGHTFPMKIDFGLIFV